MRYFVIGDDGQKYGPADVATLNSWITEGRLLATTLLENELTGERISAQATPGLVFAAVGVPTPAGYAGPGGPRQPEQPGGYVAYPRAEMPGAGPQVVPGGFNWGAFFFGWIWGLNHRKPILLLMIPASFVLHFIPVIGYFAASLGIQIWVGFQGNQWAWESGRFSTITDMMDCQAVWKNGRLAVLSSPCCLLFWRSCCH